MAAALAVAVGSSGGFSSLGGEWRVLPKLSAGLNYTDKLSSKVDLTE